MIRVLKKYPLILILIIYTLYISRFYSYIPMWDAKNYLDGLLYGVKQPFNLFNFDSFGHPTMLFYFLSAVTQYLDFGNISYLHLSMLPLSLLAVISFFNILSLQYEAKNRLELLLVTAIFAFYPIFTASVINLYPDYGVMVYYVMFLCLFIADKKILALIASLFLVFSKELGSALLFYTIYCDFLIKLFRHRFSLNNLRKLMSGYRLYIWVVISLIFRWYYKSAVMSELTVWGNWPELFNSKILNFEWNLSFLSGIFIVNFNWLLTLVIIGGLLKYAFLLFKNRINLTTDKSRITFFICLFVGVFSMVFFLKHATKLRYFLPLYSLMILIFYWSLVKLFSSNKMRISILVTVLSLFLISSYKTVDPISKAIYTTFNFGKHPLLKMTSISGECCGYSQDQLVYNFEHTNLYYLMDEIYRDLALNPNINITYQQNIAGGIYSFLMPVDFKTHRITLDLDNSFYPAYFDLQAGKSMNYPKEIYLLDIPLDDVGQIHRLAEKYYRTLSSKEYLKNGYSLKVHKLVLK